MASLKSTGHRDHNHGVRRRWLVAGLAVFVLLDIALVVFALTATKPSDNAGKVVAPVETTASPTAAPVESTPAPTVAPPVESVPPNRILTAFNASTAWRAGIGACPSAKPTPELTTDAGATWTGFDASIHTGASSILTIQAIGDSEASMVTLAAADCAPQFVATYVAGEQWEDYPDRLGGDWYVNPADRATVHSPAGSFPAPCPTVIALAPRSDSIGGVLCSDGTLVRTDDAGATWGPGVALPGAVNLNVTADGYILSAANQPDCAGVQVFSTPEAFDGALAIAGCREASFNPGDVAISSADGIVWLWAGDILSRSSDGGVTWQ